jgi:formate hydrogenlyase subunit 3/multisubunit Na+/H+ antiporter MnhD subunit
MEPFWSPAWMLLLGIALATPAGAAATVYFLFHNILVKANLFLIAGLMFAAAGHYDLRRMKLRTIQQKVLLE